MQLEEVDLVEAQSHQAALHRFLQMLWAGIMEPLPGADALPSALGANYQACRIGRKRLGNKLLRDVRAIRVRCVNEVDPKLHHAPQRFQSRIAIRWRSPDAFACDAHGAETKAIDRTIPELDSPRACGKNGLRVLAHLVSLLLLGPTDAFLGNWRQT